VLPFILLKLNPATFTILASQTGCKVKRDANLQSANHNETKLSMRNNSQSANIHVQETMLIRRYTRNEHTTSQFLKRATPQTNVARFGVRCGGIRAP
jgi:hypothetical protein